MLSRRVTSSILAVLLVLVTGAAAAYFAWQVRQPKENPCDPIIVQVAHETGVDPFLIRALIWRESKFNPLTHGTAADERGLMQVTPEVGEMWAKANKIPNYKVENLYDPATNIRVGTWYLNRAIKRWSQTDDPVSFALAEYNAGRSNAIKWTDPADPQSHVAFLDRITYPSTRKYVEDILSRREQYRAYLANNPWYHEFAPNSTMTSSP